MKIFIYKKLLIKYNLIAYSQNKSCEAQRRYMDTTCYTGCATCFDNYPFSD